MEWCREKTCRLIDEFRLQECLWNHQLKDYKDRQKKSDALKELGKMFECEGSEVEKKIKSLIGQFQREVKKISGKSGDGVKDEPRWFAYKMMLFLKDKWKPHKTADAGIYTSSRDDEDEENVDSYLERTSIDASPIAAVNSDTASAETSAASRKIFSSPVRRKRAKTQDDSAVVMAEACNVLKSLDASRHNRDEYDKFGEYVGSKIRNLKTDYAKFTIQHEITTLLYHADLGRYNQTNAAASPLHTNVLEGNSSQHAALCTPANVVIVDATHEHPDVLNDEVINEVLISEDCSQLQHQYGHLLDVCGIRENETK
ncbi:uncharacterized protein LOC134537172 [Bacillus rossius redtenbacheri]|uniref:uncharacterized protein LOC134537172 n=1 Tax=Bacillus rossius redtenbacheri TaxID=93214 RepID=UPI002FDE0BA5